MGSPDRRPAEHRTGGIRVDFVVALNAAILTVNAKKREVLESDKATTAMQWAPVLSTESKPWRYLPTSPDIDNTSMRLTDFICPEAKPEKRRVWHLIASVRLAPVPGISY